MAKSSGPHVPTMVVVGLGMVLIAGLAAVAAWAWAQRRGPLLAGQRARRANTADSEEEGDSLEGLENGAGAATV